MMRRGKSDRYEGCKEKGARAYGGVSGCRHDIAPKG
jgi:hypothetical protein